MSAAIDRQVDCDGGKGAAKRDRAADVEVDISPLEAARISPRRLPAPVSLVLVTVSVAARANPDIARNKAGTTISATTKLRIRSAMDPSRSAFGRVGKFPPVLTNSGVVFGRLSQYSKLLSIQIFQALLYSG